MAEKSTITIIQYDFKGAKFEGISSDMNINSNRTARIHFRTELNPDSTGEGFFISGLLGVSDVNQYELSGVEFHPDFNIINLKPIF